MKRYREHTRNIQRYTLRSWAKRLAALAMALLCTFALGCNAVTGEIQEQKLGLDIEVPVVEESQPAPGGEIRMYIPTNADMTDPLMVNTEEMLCFFSLVYESLITVNNDGRLSPELAESWTTEDGGATWTVNLRAEVKWQKVNKPFTASDVVSTFERLRGLGQDCYYSYAADTIDSIEAVNNMTLRVVMKDPGYASLYALNFPIMREGTVSYYPLGTGPYEYGSAEGDAVRLTANEGWWKQRAYIDSFVFVERDSNDTALASYNAGQLDIVPTSATTVGQYRQDDITTVTDVMTQNLEIMLINNDSQTLNDIRIRRALAYALDRSKIISNIYMNRAQACDVPIAPDSWIYDAKSKLYDYNTVKALELLKEAGWEDSDEDGRLEKNGMALTELSLQILVNDSTDSTRKNAASAIAEQLEEIGIATEIVTAPFSVASDKNEYTDMLLAGEYDLALIGLNVGRDGDMRELTAQNGSANYSRYYDEELYQLACNMMSAADETAYKEAASKFQTTFAEKLPFIPLYFRLDSIVCAAEIKGMTDLREPDIMRNVDKWYIYTEKKEK